MILIETQILNPSTWCWETTDRGALAPQDLLRLPHLLSEEGAREGAREAAIEAGALPGAVMRCCLLDKDGDLAYEGDRSTVAAR
jgi:hypothetical protein